MIKLLQSTCLLLCLWHIRFSLEELYGIPEFWILPGQDIEFFSSFRDMRNLALFLLIHNVLSGQCLSLRNKARRMCYLKKIRSVDHVIFFVHTFTSSLYEIWQVQCMRVEPNGWDNLATRMTLKPQYKHIDQDEKLSHTWNPTGTRKTDHGERQHGEVWLPHSPLETLLDQFLNFSLFSV